MLTSEVDDPRIGRLASPLLEQKREASVILAGVYHSQREKLHGTLAAQKHGETCCKTVTQAENEQRPNKFHRTDSSPTKEFELKEGKQEFS